MRRSWRWSALLFLAFVTYGCGSDPAQTSGVEPCEGRECPDARSGRDITVVEEDVDEILDGESDGDSGDVADVEPDPGTQPPDVVADVADATEPDTLDVVEVDVEASDRDEDGVPDDQDAFPDDPDESVDTDDDGVGDNADDDDDGDGLLDVDELAFGADCVISDPLRADTDGDEIRDDADPYPRDPFPEFLIRQNDVGSIDLFLSNRDGTFQDAVPIGETIVSEGRALSYTGLSIGDYDSDGRMDFIAHSTPLFEDGRPDRNFYFFYRDNKADEFVQIFVGVTTESVTGAVTDVDGDFATDVVRFIVSPTGSTLRENGEVITYRNNYAPRQSCVVGEADEDDCFFTRAATLDVSPTVDRVWIARMARTAVSFNPDEDSHRDLTLVTYNSGGNAPTRVYTLFGNGDGTFSDPALRFTHNASANQAPANTVLFADFNNDGVGDLMVGLDDDGRPGEAWSYLGLGDGTFAEEPLVAIDVNPDDAREEGGGEFLGRTASGRAFDFDFDGSVDLIVGYNHRAYDVAGQTRVYRGNGDGTFGPDFSVIGVDSRSAHAFAIPERLCPTFELFGSDPP